MRADISLALGSERHTPDFGDSQRLERMTAAWDDDFLASLVAA
ncbi:hypothetical+protein [Methylocapsa aurea]